MNRSLYESRKIFEQQRNPKLAIVMIETKSDFDRAQKLLEEAGGFIKGYKYRQGDGGSNTLKEVRRNFAFLARKIY